MSTETVDIANLLTRTRAAHVACDDAKRRWEAAVAEEEAAGKALSDARLALFAARSAFQDAAGA